MSYLRSLSRRRLASSLSNFEPSASGGILGLYRNGSNAFPRTILVTETGWRFPDDDARSIEYSEIASIDGPTTVEAEPVILVHLADGSAVPVAVDGGEGKYRDVFPMIHFLMRAIEFSRRPRSR